MLLKWHQGSGALSLVYTVGSGTNRSSSRVAAELRAGTFGGSGGGSDEPPGMECGRVAFPTDVREDLEVADKMDHLLGAWMEERGAEGRQGGWVGMGWWVGCRRYKDGYRLLHEAAGG